jgi:hypothetical protein
MVVGGGGGFCAGTENFEIGLDVYQGRRYIDGRKEAWVKKYFECRADCSSTRDSTKEGGA